MSSRPGTLRFDTEQAIVEAVAKLRNRGVHREDIDRTMIALGPVDLDLLAIVLRRLDMAEAVADMKAIAA
ncbi:MAG: hypothetical protein R3D65_18440 [Zhengella sp.]|uniref:hypothetical protein n=1 Tax=Zhengella sp. TaxID=2282762 RepID=UPI001D61D5F4|nr:hypothetical protein [Notoacmeibacter sp.]MCC0028345.1 hypothetical protein [Brucellaceae bacterium]